MTLINNNDIKTEYLVIPSFIAVIVIDMFYIHISFISKKTKMVETANSVCSVDMMLG
jgi:hypothetical protein